MEESLNPRPRASPSGIAVAKVLLRPRGIEFEQPFMHSRSSVVMVSNFQPFQDVSLESLFHGRN